MQAVKNGVRVTLRTPGKALLYAMITFLLAVLLAVSACVNAAVRGYLQDCDAYYRTVVNLEFIGTRYPEPYHYDPALEEALTEHGPALEALCRSDAVRSFEPNTNTVALISGLHRTDLACCEPDAAVLQVYLLFYDEASNAYGGTITESLYSRTDETGKMVLFRVNEPAELAGQQLERGASYWICGRFFRGTSSYLWFSAEDMRFTSAESVISLPGWSRCGDSQQTDAAYRTLAQFTARRNDVCSVLFTADLENQLPFHEQEQTVVAGRYFTPEEYAEGASVCVIPASLADTAELAVGDSLSLALSQLSGDLYATLLQFPEPEAYTVVGICEANDNDPYRIYLPGPLDKNAVPGPVNGYRLGQFRVENAGISDFLAAAAPLEAHGFRFTVYDQGYETAVEPMQELLFLSRIFLAVCLLLTAAVLCLECHVFITRQREAAGTMLALGSGKAHVCLYYLACMAVISVPAVILGCLTGKLLDRRIFRLLVRYVSRLHTQDLRFSSSRLSLTRHLEFAPKAPPGVYLTAGLALLAAAGLFTLCYSLACLRSPARPRPRPRRTRRLRAPRRSSHLRTRFKYALLSLRRNPVRSAAVLLLAAVMALFFGRLTGTLAGYHTQLEVFRRDSVITGHACDADGRRIDGLVVPRQVVERFVSDELLSEYNVSKNICHVRFLGIPESVDGTVRKVPDPPIPTSSFGIETLFGQMYYEPTWDRTLSVSGSARFYYSDPVRIQWLEGYDDDNFSGGMVCVIPRSMQAENGIRLGDTVRFLYALYDRGMPVISTADLRVVGVYQSAGKGETVFSPMDLTRLITGESLTEVVALNARTVTYDSFVFTLRDPAALDQVRTALEEAGFTWAHAGTRLSTYAVLDDSSYLSTTHAMERQIQYVSAMYDALYLLAGLLSFTLAWLLVSSRRKETALMRALGTQPLRIVANLVLEQALMCACGAGLGLLLWHWGGNPIRRTQWILTAAFWGIWVCSALLCACTGIRKQAYAQLAEPE